jgi:ADP-heptose:LPS heptosyltransferase
LPKKILLFKIGAIGDVLMTTPLVRALRRAFPKAVIDYWLGLGSAGALVRNPFLSQSVYFDEKMFFKRDLIGILRLIWRIRKEKYDVAFVLDKSWMIGVVLALTGIPVRVGFDRHGEGFFHTVKVSYGHIRHEIEYYLDLVRVLNIKPDGTKLDLVFAKSRAYDEPNDLPSAKRYYVKSPNTICLVPGGAKNAGQDTPQRRWPIEKWKELTDKLLERGYDIVLVGVLL